MQKNNIEKIGTLEELFKVFKEQDGIFQASADRWTDYGTELDNLPVKEEPSGLLKIVFVVAGIACLFFMPLLSVPAAIGAIVYYKRDKDKQRQYEEYVSTRAAIVAKMEREGKLQDETEAYLIQLIVHGYQVLEKIPIEDDAITKDNYFERYSTLEKFWQLEQKISAQTDKEKQFEMRKSLVDSKLKLFYEMAILQEQESGVSESLERQLMAAKQKKDYAILRSEDNSDSNVGLQYVNSLPTYKAQLEDNRMAPYLEQFDYTANMDVSGFIRSIDKDKLVQQTQDMHGLLQAAKAEYAEMGDLCQKVKVALGYARTCAYRNIYLGNEAVMFVSRLAGVEDNKVETQDLQLLNFKLPNLNVTLKDINANIGSKAVQAAFNNLDKSLKNLTGSRQTRQFAKENPKAAAGLALASAVGSAIMAANEERARVIDANQKAQKKMVKNFKKIATGYTECQTNLLRAIELIGEIRTANEGFMAMYKELLPVLFDRDKMLALGPVEVMQMKQDLLKAAQQYNRISNAKL